MPAPGHDALAAACAPLRLALSLLALVISAGCVSRYALVPLPESTPSPVTQSQEESSRAIQHTIGPDRWTVTTARGAGTVPVFDSEPFGGIHAGITRLVLIVHGETRDAGQYYRDVHAAAVAKGATQSALVVAPQFLNTLDVRDPANALPATILGWHVDHFSGGIDAETPAAISAFDVLDSMIAAFTDRSAYPALRTIVVAGHSGGAQLVQRYAVVGSAFVAASAAGYDVRFVVASPSSFLYFDTLRPQAGGGFAPGPARCPTFDDWRYGFKAAPRYVGTPSVSALWTAYIRANVTYLSGSDDIDAHGSLDQSCGAEAQGINRVDRAGNYVAYLAQRNGGSSPQPLVTVQGVGHSDRAMLTSAQAATALFGP